MEVMVMGTSGNAIKNNTKRKAAYKSFNDKEAINSDKATKKGKHYKQNHSVISGERLYIAKQEFMDKEEFLQATYPKVEAIDFYRDIFPQGSFEEINNKEQRRPNGIITVIKDKEQRSRSYSRIVFDDLKEIANNLDKETVIIAPVAFSGRRRLAKMAHTIFGITIDIDDVGVHELNALLYEMENGVLPMATYIKNSGTGVHAVYVFDEPIPARKEYFSQLNALKAELSNWAWNAFTSREKEKQFQGIFQGFRMVGSPTKLGPEYRVSAYKVGRKISIKELNEFVTPESRFEPDKNNRGVSLTEAQELYPEWYQRRIVEKKEYGEYDLSDEEKVRRRAWYETWKKHIYESARDGNRHYCICVLFTYAYKAKIQLEEAYRDAMEMLPYLDSLTEKPHNQFVQGDIDSAKTYYGPNAMKMSRKNIFRMTKIDIGVTKRNGNSQYDHLQADTIKDEKTGKPKANMCKLNRQLATQYNKENGLIEGRPEKKDIVQQWRKNNPNGKKVDCQRETGLSKPTVLKWWNSISA